jgi:hypothetical protein
MARCIGQEKIACDVKVSTPVTGKTKKPMSEKHPIDDLFRKQLEERQPAFDESYWQEAEQLLSKTGGSFLNITKWKLFSILVAVIVLSAATGYYFGNMNLASKNKSAQSVNREDIGTAAFPQTNTNKKYADDHASIIHAEIQEEEASDTQKINNSPTAEEQSKTFTSPAVKSHSENAAGNLNSPSYREKEQVINNATPGNSATQEMSVGYEQVLLEQESMKKKTSSGDDESKQYDAANTQIAEEVTAITGTAAPGATTTSSKSAGNHTGNATVKRIEQPLTIPPIATPTYHTSWPPPPAIPVFNTPSNLTSFLHRNHWSKVRSFELSTTAGATIITVPSVKSTATGFEWNAMLHYRVNNWLAGTGIGQFSVKEQFTTITDSLTYQTFIQQIITMDSAWVIDTMTIIIDSIPVVVIDSFFQSYYDTAYHEVTVTDTQQVQYEASSAGRYTEIPLLFGYRIPLGKVRLQLTGGAAYGWYTGALRYGINSEGQLYSYQPGPVASLLGRVTVQYPISRSLFLQAYTGARYAIGLKKNIPNDNYFLYSFGGGVLYRF